MHTSLQDSVAIKLSHNCPVQSHHYIAYINPYSPINILYTISHYYWGCYLACLETCLVLSRYTAPAASSMRKICEQIDSYIV